MARREAALAMIGPDSNVDMLNDDELDQLMSSLQKHKHLRKGRPESRLTEVDDDDESTVSSSQFNAKHDSVATFESLDYDTNLSSWPSPPDANGPFGQISDLKVDLEQQLEQQKSEYEEKLASAKMANVEIEQLRQEKEEMQEMLARAKQEAEQLLKISLLLPDTSPKTTKRLPNPFYASGAHTRPPSLQTLYYNTQDC
jgi:kinesin family protein 1